MDIYVGNLPYSTTEEDLRQAFERYGQVSRVRIIKDRNSGESRGFAFVEMTNREEGLAAIDGLNGTDFNGRTLKLNEARPRSETRASDRDSHQRDSSRGGMRRR